MMANVAQRGWDRVRRWFADNSTQLTSTFIPELDGAPVSPYEGYLRIYLAHGFLAQSRTWGADHYPALHGGVKLTYLGADPSTFTSLTRPPDDWTAPGVQLDFPLTPLLPFNGGTVEVMGSLHQATVNGPLGTAVDLLGGLASLGGAPLAAAATVVDQLSKGLEKVFAATGNQPILGAHWTLVSPGAGGLSLRPGYLVVIGAAEGQLGGNIEIRDGRVHVTTSQGSVPLSDVDYLALRVECRQERDDWRFPELDELIRLAGDAFVRGHQDTYVDRRTEAIARAWNSSDLVPTDRKRVAILVRDELDALAQLGAVPGPDEALEVIAPSRLAAPDDERLSDLTLTSLVAV